MDGTITGLSGKYKGHSAPLKPGILTIGRDPSNGLSFPDDSHLSRNHAVLQYRDGYWHCTDLGSTNGTFINGQRLGSGSVALPYDTQLSAGEQVFRISYGDARSSSAVGALRAFIDRVGSRLTPPVPPPVTQKQPPPRPATYPGPAVTPTQQVRIGNSEWYGPDRALNLHGVHIENPLAFVGERLVEPKSRNAGYGFSIVTQSSEEPGLINPRLPAHPGNAEQLPYYPNYANASPAQRYAYLQWLANGRKPGIDQGYLFIFFYGAERYLLQGSGVRPGAELLLLEIEKLALQNPTYHSFASYAFNLVSAFWPVYPQRISIQPFGNYGRFTDDDFTWTLACLAIARRPFTADMAVGWLRSSGRAFVKSQVSQRCWQELEALFRERFQRAFGDAVDLTASATKLHRHLQPANISLREIRFPEPVAFRSKGDKKLVEALHRIAEACGEELEAFARAIGPNSGTALPLKALALLPQGREAKSEQLVALKTILEEQLQLGRNPVPLILIYEALKQDLGPLTKTRLIELSGVLERAGFLMEPDPRFGTAAPKDLNELLVSHATDGYASPTPSYLALLPIASLGAWIASKGETPLMQALYAASGVVEKFHLTEAEQSRFRLLFEWLLLNPQRPSKKVVEAIPFELRQTVMTVLAEIVRADGAFQPSEVAELLKVGDAFGLARDAVLSGVHNDEPVTISMGSAIDGFAIPGQPAARVSIDHTLVQSKLKESDEVSKLLSEIFGAGEISATPVFVEDLSGQASPYVLLLDLLHEEELSLNSFHNACLEVNLLPGQARTYLNELGFDKVGSPLIEGDDPLYIDLQTLELLKSDLVYSTC